MKRPLNSPIWLVLILFFLATPCFAGNLDYVIEAQNGEEIKKFTFNAHHIEVKLIEGWRMVVVVWEAEDKVLWPIATFKFDTVYRWYEKRRLK